MQVLPYNTCYIIQFQGKCLGDENTTLIERSIDESIKTILDIILTSYPQQEIAEIKIVKIRLNDPKRNILDKILKHLGLKPLERKQAD